MARNPKPVAGEKSPYPKATAKRSNASKAKKPAKATQKAAGGSKPKKATKTSEAKRTAKRVLKACEGMEAVISEIKPKNKLGRPTKYDPAFCDFAIELGKQGKSREVIATMIGVTYETLRVWERENPIFSAAITLAKQYELVWWENAGQEYLTTTGFSASAWSRSMAARFPAKWREKSQVDHGITDQFATFLTQIDGDGASLI
jgi:hypothetical protein